MKQTNFAIFAVIFVVSPQQAEAQNNFQDQIIAQQRIMCQNRGGTFRNLRCYIPRKRYNPPTKRREQLPEGRIFHQNTGACTYKLLLAYRPKGWSRHIVKGPWTVRPGADITFRDGGYQYILSDLNQPVYYHVVKVKGRVTHPWVNTKTFKWRNYNWKMTQADGPIDDGTYSIEVSCQ